MKITTLLFSNGATMPKNHNRPTKPKPSVAKKRPPRKKAAIASPKPEELIEQIHPLIENRLTALDVAFAEHDLEIKNLVSQVSVLTPANVTRRRVVSGRTARNLCALAGLSSIGYACWLISPSAAYVTIGGIMFVGSLVGMAVQSMDAKKDS